MTTVKITEDNIFTVLGTSSLILLAILAGAGLAFGSCRFAVSILAGGILALANFYWLRSVLVRTFRLLPKKASSFVILRYVIRLAVLAVVIFVLIVYCRADIFGLLLGLSVLVFNIIALSIYMISTQGE
jgi:hypothetical protein